MFAWNNRVATKLRDTLSKYPTRLRAPTILAWAGPALATLFIIMMIVLVPAASRGSRGAIAPPSMLTMLLPLLGLSPFLWFAWMARVDNCHQEISFQRAEKKKLRKATSAARARDAA